MLRDPVTCGHQEMMGMILSSRNWTTSKITMTHQGADWDDLKNDIFYVFPLSARDTAGRYGQR